jgi:hypothetical protein
LALAFGLASCHSSGVQAAPAPAPVEPDVPEASTSVRENDRAQVYSALFDAEFAGTTPESWVIASETDASSWLRVYLIAHAPSYLNWQAEVGEAFTDHRRVSLGARDSSLTYISGAEGQQLCRGADWSDFFARYPGAKGVLNFSEVSFKPDGRQALVYAVRVCGEGCVYGGIYLLEKTNGQWRVSEQVENLSS